MTQNLTITANDSWTPSVVTVYDGSWFRAFRSGTHIAHLMPWKDLRPHRAGLDCECRPQQVASHGPGGMLVVHQAWDCREYLHQESKPVQPDVDEDEETDTDEDEDDYYHDGYGDDDDDGDDDDGDDDEDDDDDDRWNDA